METLFENRCKGKHYFVNFQIIWDFFRNFAIKDGELTPSRQKKRKNSFVLLSTFRNFAAKIYKRWK